jgi:tetratricopeptide (TPR) repeat protein
MYRVIPQTLPATTGGDRSVPQSLAASFARAAWANQQAGNADKAISLYSKAIESVSRDAVRSHWRVSVPALNNLAALLRNRGRFADAEARYLWAINLLSKESTHLLRPVLALVLRNLADLYHSQGHEGAARSLLATALAEDAAGRAELPRAEPSSPTAPLLKPDTHGTHIPDAP